MSEQEKKRSKKYNRVREKFDELPLEEKATFLIEAVFTTLTKGIEQAGKAFSEELNTLFEQARERAERQADEQETEEGDGEAPAEGEEDSAEDANGSDQDSGDQPGNESAEEKN